MGLLADWLHRKSKKQRRAELEAQILQDHQPARRATSRQSRRPTSSPSSSPRRPVRDDDIRTNYPAGFPGENLILDGGAQHSWSGNDDASDTSSDDSSSFDTSGSDSSDSDS